MYVKVKFQMVAVFLPQIPSNRFYHPKEMSTPLYANRSNFPLPFYTIKTPSFHLIFPAQSFISVTVISTSLFSYIYKIPFKYAAEQTVYLYHSYNNTVTKQSAKYYQRKTVS